MTSLRNAPFTPISPTRARALARRAQAGDRVARDTLIVNHVPLVIRLIWSTIDRGMARAHFDDLLSEGVIGLMEAVYRFRPDDRANYFTVAQYSIRGAVDGAVRDAVDGAVHSAVHSAVRGAVDNAVGDAVRGAEWWNYFGGQFWVGWWRGPAAVSYYLDVLRLDIGADLELRARAYAATCRSACWWWPHREWVMVSERPHTIELTPDRKHLVRAAWEGWEVVPSR